MQTQPVNQATAKNSEKIPSPAWVGFFAEALRLAEVARQRRAENEAKAGVGTTEEDNEKQPNQQQRENQKDNKK